MTLQKRDVLQYKGERLRLEINILKPYFQKFPAYLIRTEFLITSLWRGYFACYAIENGELYITSLQRYIDFDSDKGDFIEESVLEKVFPNSKKSDFFTGWIGIYDYCMTFEDNQVKFAEIENGNFLGERVFSKEEFHVFEQTEAYKKCYRAFSFMSY